MRATIRSGVESARRGLGVAGMVAALALSPGCGMDDEHVDGGSHAGHVFDFAGADHAQVTWDMTEIPGPAKLSQTGLYADFAARTLAPGVLPYTPRYETWADGATQKRWLYLPPGTKIDTSDMDQWAFPVGTKAWREIAWKGLVVETRYVEKVYDSPGGWYEVSFIWDADHKDAIASIDGAENVLGTPLDVPTKESCGSCHIDVKDVIIGVSALQLSAAGGGGQLTDFAKRGLLSVAPAGEFEVPGAGVVQAALGNLHTNCGHCHNEQSPLARYSPLLLRVHVGDKSPEQTAVYKSTVNVTMYHPMPPDITLGIVPGNPEKSQVYARMAVRDDWAMPDIDTKVVDTVGLQALREWIVGLK